MSKIIQSTGSAVQILGSETGHTVKNVAFCDTPERAGEIVKALQGRQEVPYRHAQPIIAKAIEDRKTFLDSAEGLSMIALKIINDLASAGMIIVKE